MRVFLSSTYEDLVEHRRLAAEALERLGQQTGRMEVFGARSEEPRDACLREIEQSDLFVGIYAHRYGFVPSGSNLSITQLEFRHAKGRKPIFCFIVVENHPWPPSMIEEEPGKTKLRAFKSELSEGLVRDTFTTPEDLAFKIAASVGRYLAEHVAPLDPLMTRLGELIRDESNGPEARRQSIGEALSAAVEIANRTLRYIAFRRRSGHIDLDEENALAQGWQNAGLKLLDLPEAPTDLVNRYFLKAEYWSDPEAWTDDRIDSSRIRLDEISKESREQLLGLRPSNSAGAATTRG